MKSDVIENFRDEISDALKECTENALRSMGRVQYEIYCWEDDGVEIAEGTTDRLRVNENNRYQHLYHIADISADMWDLLSYLQIDSVDDINEDDLENYIINYVEEIDWDEKVDELIEEVYYENEEE